MRLIDADALIDELGISDEDIIFEGILEDAPTIDAVPVRHGRWKTYKTEVAGRGFFYCTKCHNDVYDISDYCPNCGAKMDGEDDEID